MVGRVYFIGAGPGDPELLTLKAKKIMEKADLVVFADSLINPEILKFCREGVQVVKSYGKSLEEIVDVISKAALEGKVVARLQSGDPSIYGAIYEQIEALEEMGVPCEVVPGVSSLFSSAASLKLELTIPGITQTVIITRRAGKTPVPDRESLEKLAPIGATMAIFLSAGMVDGVVGDLIRGGVDPETPAAVVYRSTWKDEKIILGTLEDIADRVRDEGIKKQALIIVGRVLSPKEKSERSFLYGKR